MWPKVSIVTPCLNAVEFVEEAIQSVLSQDYPCLEYILIDGGSTDGTIDVIKAYSDRITHWVSERDQGQSDALNKGLGYCTGEIFSFLNADDYLSPGALEAVARHFIEHPECDVAYGKCLRVDKHGHVINVHQGKISGIVELLSVWVHWFEGEYLISPEVFMRTEVVKKVGGFRKDIDLVFDYDLWVRLLMNGARFQSLDCILAGFRYHDAAKSAKPHAATTALLQIVEFYLQNVSLPVSQSEQRRILREFRIFSYKHRLRKTSFNGTPLTVLKQCLQAVVSCPSVVKSRLFWSTLASSFRV